MRLGAGRRNGLIACRTEADDNVVRTKNVFNSEQRKTMATVKEFIHGEQRITAKVVSGFIHSADTFNWRPTVLLATQNGRKTTVREIVCCVLCCVLCYCVCVCV